MYNFYGEILSTPEKSIIDVLEGKEASSHELKNKFPSILKGCTLFLVNVDGSRYDALNIVRKLYTDTEVVSIIYNDSIIILGIFDNTDKHATIIKESIVNSLYCTCYISYGNAIFSFNDIKKAYDEAKEGLILGKKFRIKEHIFSYDKMLFEKIISNIDWKVKYELLNRFREKFNLFDGELINTIEEFVNCGMSISDAAAKLFVHRNTLIYRLDKITKETGFDIRDFKEATVFIIAFLAWKENKI